MASVFSKLVASVIGTKHEREMKKLSPLVQQIGALEQGLKSLSDDQLKNKTQEFKNKIEQGASVDSLLVEAFAVCREAAWRRLHMRHYDVQLIGGIILHRGQIAEMKTGEGKTLVATLPLYLNALAGKGSHLVTVNDYLARRDCEWMGQVYHFLGLSTGTICHNMRDDERREAYGADITYCTNNELGFDYLRDNMKFTKAEQVQGEKNFAIVDECDSILIDEARTPLIISGPAQESTEMYERVNHIIKQFQKTTHFTVEEKNKTVALTEEGNHLAEKLLGVKNLFDPRNIALMHFIYQALKAHHLFQKDVDYMLRDGEIVIVDEFTGRLMPGRRWSEGLHQAIEAKEGVRVKSENQTLASITFQNYFRMYKKLAGMTGTADTEAVEFQKIYNLGVTVIPTNKPIRRADRNDLIYKNEPAKLRAIAQEVGERNKKGQPVLVGTVSIEKSEQISAALKQAGIQHNVLNAKHHEREAEIVAQAGRFSMVTIATNMAGRGTDIVLGGNAEMLAKAESRATEGEAYEQALKKWQALCTSERDKVVEAGGLCIVGTERHESRRIDNQLRGRSGRQGDPGESLFFLSLDDNLLRIFNGERIQKIMSRFHIPEDEPITARMVNNAVEGAQRKVEGHNFDIRKHLLQYDDVMNQQRTAVYQMRGAAVRGQGVERVLLDMLSDVVSRLLDTYVPENTKPAQWDLKALQISLTQQFGFQWEVPADITKGEGVTNNLQQKIKNLYDQQKEHMGPYCSEVQKMIVLETIDSRWKEHLLNMDQLKEGVNLRAYAQKDPLVEYKKEGYKMFQQMEWAIQSEVVEKWFKIQIRREELDESVGGVGAGPEMMPLQSPGSMPSQPLPPPPHPAHPAARPLDAQPPVAQPSAVKHPAAKHLGGARPGSSSGMPEEVSPMGRAARRRLARKKRKKL